jgi:hypothetical protein
MLLKNRQGTAWNCWDWWNSIRRQSVKPLRALAASIASAITASDESR